MVPTPKPEALSAIPQERVIDLDVRPILQAGGEPFAAIMEAVGRVAVDGALSLHATFKPTPLFAALGQQGFQHWIEHGEKDHWIVWFYRGEAAAKAEDTAPTIDVDMASLHKDDPELRKRLSRSGVQWILDVRGMQPPEPMELTLRVVHAMPAGVELVQVNQRIPQFLLPMLDERGFSHDIVKNEEDEVRISIKQL